MGRQSHFRVSSGLLFLACGGQWGWRFKLCHCDVLVWTYVERHKVKCSGSKRVENLFYGFIWMGKVESAGWVCSQFSYSAMSGADW